MKRRKLNDRFTGVAVNTRSKIESRGKSEWIGSSSRNYEYFAILESNAYYNAPDDEHASFCYHSRHTPSFVSLEALENYMEENNIKIGSMMTNVVRINEGKEDSYDRKVSVPITSISYVNNSTKSAF